MKRVLVAAQQAGVRLEVDGDELRVIVPNGTLTDELHQGLRQHKSSILDYLRATANLDLEIETLSPLLVDEESREQPFPLTDVQHAYWLGRGNMVEFGNVATHFYFELDTQGLDLARLNRALCQLIERHEMLRAVVNNNGTQQILPSVPAYQIAVADCTNATTEVAECEIIATRNILSHQVLKPDQWPLFDIRATCLPDRSTRLHVSLDLLILDAWSMFILFREWRDLYQNPALALAPLSLSYRDYVLAESALGGSKVHQRAQDYWLARIDSLPPAPELPIRSQVDALQPPRFSRRRKHLNAMQWDQLKRNARAAGLTISGLLLAAYAEVLTRWSASPHYTLNLTLFNRLPLHPEVMQLVGDFTSLVLVEVDHRDWQLSFNARAQQLQRQLMSDLEHREMSGVEVLREWTKRRDNPLQATMPVVFTSALVLGGEAGDDAGLVECFGPMVHGVSQTPQVWLDHQAMEVGGDLVFNWDAVDDVFEAGVLDAMFSAYHDLLSKLATSKEAWAQCNVVALPPAMTQLREATNQTQSAIPLRYLHQGFVEQAKAHPNAIAIQSPERTLSYGELLQESLIVANTLREHGVERAELVAVLMQKGWEQVVTVLGILLAGGAYVPIDPGLPIRRQKELLAIAAVRQVVVKAKAVPDAYTTEGLNVVVVAACDVPLTAAKILPLVDVDLDDLAYVIFTSGTTGVPKGVMIDHRSAVNTIDHINRLFDIGPHDKALCVSSLSFDLSVYDIFGLLAAGGALVIPEHSKQHDPLHWHQLIDNYNVTLWNSAPQLMRMLIDSVAASDQGGDHLTTVMLSGDWISLDLPGQVRNVFPKADVISLGGATEGSIWSIYYPIDSVCNTWTSIPYGKPLPNQTIWVYDDAFRSCPDHVKGRIFIGGAGLAKGYWADEKKTSERFIIHPHSGERLYDTGDFGRYAENGNVLFLGREDDQVKIRGHRVELGEIASTLSQHAEIHEAVVLPIPGLAGQSQLIAYIEPESTNLVTLGYSETAHAEVKLSNLVKDVLCARDAKKIDPLFKQVWQRLDDFYFHGLLVALHHFGVKGEVGERLAVDRLLDYGIATRYERWLKRAFNVLIEEGYAGEYGQGKIELLKPLPEPNLPTLSVEVTQGLIASFGFNQDEAAWFVGVVERLHDILTETIHSAEIYAGKETAQVYQKLFPDNHAQLAAVTAEIIGQQTQGLNVLEVGAGLGSTTQHVLPMLINAGCHYLFTDISTFFLDRARNLFGPDSENLGYQLYNLDIRPEFQGLKHHSFDLIIASSMLHDVQDIRLALGHLISLLNPGGRLLLLEETRFFRSFDLHMGLQQGFDGYTDEGLRKNHCLLSRDEWSGVLIDCGFSDVSVVAPVGSVAEYLGFNVIVANGPSQVNHLDMQAVKAYLSQRLPEYMVPRHLIQMDRMPVTENGKIDYRALPAIPEDSELFDREIVAPRNETEQTLLDAWSCIISSVDIGVTDNFFDLGGDSLIATQLVREINLRLPFELEMHEFFEYLSIEALATLYESRVSDHTENYSDTSDVAKIFPALRLDPLDIMNDVARICERIDTLPAAAGAYHGEQARAVFLTGATGWLGAYTLSELLRCSNVVVYCLVRAKSDAEGLQAILANLQHFNLRINAAMVSRIVPTVGDLTKPRLGLSAGMWQCVSERVDAIYHLAASVSTLSGYADIRALNVDPLEQLVCLAASHHIKSISFCSSLAVCIRLVDGDFSIQHEEEVSDTVDGLLIGYAQSKWAAEQVLMHASARKSIPIGIFRISHILPAYDGEFRKPEVNYIYESLFQVASSVGAIPDWREGEMHGLPVDTIARFIVGYSQQGRRDAEVVHIENSQPTRLSLLIQILLKNKFGDDHAELISYEQWKQGCHEVVDNLPAENGAIVTRLFESTSAGSLLEALFGNDRADTQKFDAFMQREFTQHKAIEDDYWQSYFQHQLSAQCAEKNHYLEEIL